jgi:23S rRNA (uracil1939-C5)-methyltransferase
VQRKRRGALTKERVGSARSDRFAPDGEYKPYCPHYPHCVGCPFIDLPYPQQLLKKRALVERALGEYPALAGVSAAPVVPSPQRLGYRARVKLVVRRNRDQVALGLYVPHSHSVMDISSCPVHPAPVNQVAQYLKKKLVELGIVPYDERDDSGDLRYLDFRYSAARREVSITLVTRRAEFPQGALLARALMQRFSFVIGVIQNINESRGNVIWGADYRTLAGRDTLMERIGDLKLVFPPGVFSQANPFTARKLYEHVRALANLQGKETVLDLYCGVAPIALYLAADARQRSRDHHCQAERAAQRPRQLPLHRRRRDGYGSRTMPDLACHRAFGSQPAAQGNKTRSDGRDLRRQCAENHLRSL